MSEESKAKSKIAEREEKILKFWKENKIFEKSLEKVAPHGKFVFYDGPPFATGLPHAGSLLGSIIKDVIPRYKTMQGYNVRRRWGWDCHGLPIESLVEKKLELKTKKDIETLGVSKFNKEARNTVLQYAKDWEQYIERIGRWVEFENAYKTMDNSYIESVWWALSQMNEKDLLYEGRKVLMYCPHCETPLAKAEIAMDNSYKDITEEAVTIKFHLKSGQKIGDFTSDENTYLLAWTTTPWTLPANVALAVGENILYRRIHDAPLSKFYFVADGLVTSVFGEDPRYLKAEVITGAELAGLEYEPLFDVPKVGQSDKAYKVYLADFVNTEEGTGVVHTAVIYGEDDYQLGLKEGLPMVPLLNAGGKYNDDAPEFLRGKFIKKAENEIKEDLENRGLLFERKNNTHSYPHCYRCGTALIYNAVSSWFINIQKIKEKLLKLNEKINWVPEHLKHGRFQNIVENAPDWTISRNRYWASPLPIWKNEKGEKIVIGSIEELKKHTKKSGNKYFVMRHGRAQNNELNIASGKATNLHHLTDDGREAVLKNSQKFKEKVDLIFVSPFVRTKETAEIIRESLGLPTEAVIEDVRLSELNFGEFEGKTIDEYQKCYPNTPELFDKHPSGGENELDVKKRVGDFLYEIESKFTNKNILIISHGDPVWMAQAIAEGASIPSMLWILEEHYPKYAEINELKFVPLPHNENYELDLHKPYIDEVELVDEKGNELKRIPEVVDCWVESGSMPFAELHYPSENKEEFKSRFPGDFIAEYIAQTRTWFYYMHVLGVALFDSVSFKNVVTTGTILAADGSKMSKSKSNYTDPLVNLDKFSADAFRFYLMSSVVMQAEDLNFRDEELREAHNRVVNILWNCLSFFEMYKGSSEEDVQKIKIKESVLDRWVISRLNQTIKETTDSLDSFNTAKACRAMRDFIEDFSTWYLRRSRDRFKSENAEERGQVIQTGKFVLGEFSKIIAPIIPFIAEHIHQSLGGHGESVHLTSWPKVGEIDEKLISDMELTREVVSEALMARNAAGIKVRQPLQTLKIQDDRLKDKNEFIELIKDELNIKEVIFDRNLENGFWLDTTITPELAREGHVREFIRAVQDLRKEKGLTPDQKVVLQVETSAEGQIFIESAKSEISKPTNLSEIVFQNNDGPELKIENYELKIKIG